MWVASTASSLQSCDREVTLVQILLVASSDQGMSASTKWHSVDLIVLRIAQLARMGPTASARAVPSSPP